VTIALQQIRHAVQLRIFIRTEAQEGEVQGQESAFENIEANSTLQTSDGQVQGA
jgi:hypothetical protein